MNHSFKCSVAVLAPFFPPAFRGGGPIRSIEALVSRSPRDVHVCVLTGDRDLGASGPLDVVRNTWIRSDRATVRYTTLSAPLQIVRGMLGVRKCTPDIVHLNSFFNPVLSILPILLWRLGFWADAKLLLSPRGEFASGALFRHAWRKRAYIWLFRALRADRAILWHATSDDEAEDLYRALGDKLEIVIRTNDTLLDPRTTTAEARSESRLRLVFLGRIVEHKGLAILLEALRGCRGAVTLEVVGSPEDRGYLESCRRIARSMPPNVEVLWRGPVEHSEVRGMLAKHDALVLPTRGENFGHVIAEALSVSTLVVTTPDTPWSGLIEDGGGLIAERSVPAWTAAIESLLALTPAAVAELRRRAGIAFRTWHAEPSPPHLWDLALDRVLGHRGPEPATS